MTPTIKTRSSGIRRHPKSSGNSAADQDQQGYDLLAAPDWSAGLFAAPGHYGTYVIQILRRDQHLSSVVHSPPLGVRKLCRGLEISQHLLSTLDI